VNKKFTLLGVPVVKLDTLKYVVQLRACVHWLRTGGCGTLQCATAVGKTYIAFTMMKKMEKLYGRGVKKTIVVVPTNALKKQWEKDIRSLGLLNTEVHVINTVCKYGRRFNCDLVVFDEVHCYASDRTAQSFYKAFTNINYTWIMGLTATLERLDGLHKFLEKRAPVCFTITQKEAIKNGWIADGTVLNVPVFLTREENEKIKSLSKQISMYMQKFGDFGIMQSCMHSERARDYALRYYPSENPDIKTKEVIKWAVQGDRAVRLRKEFLYNCEHKIAATLDLLNTFNVKTITFSQSIRFADEIKARIGDECVVYHSSLESEKRRFKKTKSFKTERGASNYAQRNKLSAPKEKDGLWWVDSYQIKTISGKRVAEDNVNKYIAGKKRVISTAKGLDTGFNDEKITLGIDAARTSSSTSFTQKSGRVFRNYKFSDGSMKRPVFVCLYVPGTTDEDWLNKAQKNMDFAIQCEDIEEAKEIIKSVLKGQLHKVW